MLNLLKAFTGQYGPEKDFYADGNLKIESEMRDGMRHGSTRSYYPDGTLKIEATFLDGVPHGIIKEFREDGSLMAEEMYKHGELIMQKPYNSQEQLQGTVKNFYENGKTKITAAFVRGVAHGKCQKYYESGNIMTEEIYKNGVMLSQKHFDEGGRTKDWVKEFYDNGKVWKETDFNSGLYREYYISGRAKKIATFRNNKPEGMLQDYYEDGNIMGEDLYKNGDLVGSRRYDRKGHLVIASGVFGTEKTIPEAKVSTPEKVAPEVDLKIVEEIKPVTPAPDKVITKTEPVITSALDRVIMKTEYTLPPKTVVKTSQPVETKPERPSHIFEEKPIARSENKWIPAPTTASAPKAPFIKQAIEIDPEEELPKAELKTAKEPPAPEIKITQINYVPYEPPTMTKAKDGPVKASSVTAKKPEPMKESPIIQTITIAEPEPKITEPVALKITAPVKKKAKTGPVTLKTTEPESSSTDTNPTVKKDFYENGSVKMEYSLIQKIKQGPAKKYYDDGKLMADLLYEKDELVSQTIYDRAGNFIFKEFRKTSV